LFIESLNPMASSSRISRFWKSLTLRQATESAIVLAIVLLLLAYFAEWPELYPVSVIILIITLLVPAFFYPLAFLWYGLAFVLGAVMSRVILSLVFFLIVFPVGIIRRIAGRDELKLKLFKKSRESVFKTRDKEFKASDLEHPY